MSLLDFSPKEQVSDTLNAPQTTTDLLEETVPSTHHLVLRCTDHWVGNGTEDPCASSSLPGAGSLEEDAPLVPIDR